MAAADKFYWMINVTGYGRFPVYGTRDEAELLREAKEDWEGGRGTKRKARLFNPKDREIIQRELDSKAKRKENWNTLGVVPVKVEAEWPTLPELPPPPPPPEPWTDADKRVVYSVLNQHRLCNCGHGTAWDIALLLLEKAHDNRNQDRKSGAFYERAMDASVRWVEFGAHALEQFGWIEHGTGVGSSWLTDEGSALLRFLSEFGTDDNKWPDWATTSEVE